jgi:hypothetical protein
MARNEAEASHEAREELKGAFKAGIRGARKASERDKTLLRHLLYPSSSSSFSSSSSSATSKKKKKKPALVELRECARLFLDFKMKKGFKELETLSSTKACLPITAWKAAILDAVHAHPVVLVAGDTGCGKSTQVPQFLLNATTTTADANSGMSSSSSSLSSRYGRVCCTQPRRVACVALAKRVAYEALEEFGGGSGGKVAYKIRFETNLRRRQGQGGQQGRGGGGRGRSGIDSNRLLFLTEGVLLRQVVVVDSLLKWGLWLPPVHLRYLSMFSF